MSQHRELSFSALGATLGHSHDLPQHLPGEVQPSDEDSDSGDEDSVSGFKLGVSTFWDQNQGPHQVFAQFEINQVNDVDTTKQTFRCRFSLEVSWMMSQEDHDSLVQQGENGSKFEEWRPLWEPPKLHLPNAISSAQTVASYKIHHHDSMKMVVKSVEVEGVFSEQLELHNFPFDCQDFQIEIVWPDANMEVAPSQFSKFMRLNIDKMVTGEWLMHPPLVEFSSKTIQQYNSDFQPIELEQPSVLLCLKASRVWQPYVYQIFLVIFLICSCTLSCFCIDVADSGDRLAQATTMFLTAIAFQFIVSSLLPKLSYLSLSDYLILAANAFISFTVLALGVVAFMQTHGGYVITNEHDKVFLLVDVIILFGFSLSFGAYVVFWVMPTERARLESFASSSGRLAHSHLEDNSSDISMGSRRFHIVSHHAKERRVYLGHENDAVKVDELDGVWYSDDYGHGREFFVLSEAIDAGEARLFARKITGDPNVPAGRLTFRSASLPQRGGAKVDAEIQIRMDQTDLDGFLWIPMTLWLEVNTAGNVDILGSGIGDLQIRYCKLIF